MKVYILIDRGEFCGVFSSAELAMEYYNKKIQQIYGIEACQSGSIPRWIYERNGVWRVNKMCKLGNVSVQRRYVVNSID